MSDIEAAIEDLGDRGYLVPHDIEHAYGSWLEVTHAARKWLALTETGRQVRYCIEHQALIGALPYLCNVANWVIDGGGSPTDCRIVPRFLADYLTEPPTP